MSHIDLNRLVGALEPDLRVTLEAAASVAVRMGHRYVDIPHWLLAVVDSGIYAKTFEELKIPLPVLQAEISRSLEESIIGDGEALSLSQNILTAAREAWILASLEAGRDRVERFLRAAVERIDVTRRFVGRCGCGSNLGFDSVNLADLLFVSYHRFLETRGLDRGITADQKSEHADDDCGNGQHAVIFTRDGIHKVRVVGELPEPPLEASRDYQHLPRGYAQDHRPNEEYAA